MDASMPCGKFSSEDFHDTTFVNNCRSELKEPYHKHELGAWNNTGETAEVLPGKDANNALINAKDNLGVEELGTAVDGVLHIQEIQQEVSSPVLHSGVEELVTAVDEALKSQEGVSGQILDSGVGDIHHQKVQSMLPELKTDCVTAVTAKVEKSLSKCATFPSKVNILSSPVPVDTGARSTCTAPAGQNFQKSQNAAYCRSFSMPTSSNLVSAMKGSRDRLGMARAEKMNVTWAPDVYDPPATSMSHTVRNHHQRSKSKKKDQKHRRKSKSTRGSGSEKKHHANWKKGNNIDLMHLRFQVPPCNRSPHVEGFDELNLEVATAGCSLEPSDGFDRAAAAADVTAGVGIGSNQDSKCGANFFGSSLAKLHLSATEAK